MINQKQKGEITDITEKFFNKEKIPKTFFLSFSNPISTHIHNQNQKQKIQAKEEIEKER
jgi:hypothetical protein